MTTETLTLKWEWDVKLSHIFLSARVRCPGCGQILEFKDLCSNSGWRDLTHAGYTVERYGRDPDHYREMEVQKRWEEHRNSRRCVRVEKVPVITIAPAGFSRGRPQWRVSCTSCSWTFRGGNKLALRDIGFMHIRVHNPEVERAWENADRVRRRSPELYRRDRDGLVIHKPSFEKGKKSPGGWEVRDGVAYAKRS